jgi:type VI secretion system protein ImpK
MNNQDTVYQRAAKPRNADLTEVCSDAIALILQLRNTSDYGEESVLRQRICDLLNRVERDAKDAGMDFEDIHNAVFALIAFIDETIIASQWSFKEVWLAKPLQLEFFNRFDAGEEFFIRLEKFRQRPHHYGDVLNIYYMCMALGFKGKFQLHEKERLREIIDGTYTDLRQVRGKSADSLAPHSQRKDEFVQVVTREIPVWVILVTAFALGFGFFLAMTVFMNNAADDVIQAISNLI